MASTRAVSASWKLWCVKIQNRLRASPSKMQSATSVAEIPVASRNFEILSSALLRPLAGHALDLPLFLTAPGQTTETPMGNRRAASS